ncbi:hypothetical protein G6F46_013191 [Rhizopus delemar]|uniref:Reverse transcriptase zinc-binding domain-containing protein n=2 Tax=Rhizopus TaxID=4842 RepID=A0A9P6YEP1_9FUNG|nr:hypothetical protein G6F55_013103 [Rhizopus delemar]KAG1531987.1 hypothetical protein G6F51_013310 [Rhizopus arrhizus]KAG1486778.1 hypothetical protein G6F54_013096 [Rhizopus delemar]KAG1491162.1 hypothetical protein G6F53_013140 [Rhizopus delemar]KAG1494989.1 hypothetical protein G6F52_013078 [Rhizopus delemar]
MPNPTSGLPGTFWARFWNLSIPVQIRTPWYRLLQNKFPCSNKLYQLIPSVLSPCCQFCQQSNLEDELHFIVFCPKKFEVWACIWKHFFGSLSITTDDITGALYHLRFPAKKLSAFHNESIFGCTFWCIWRAHWLAIFNDQQFVPEAVFQATLVCLGTYHI